MKTKSKIKTEKIEMLDAMENLSKKSKNSTFSDEFLKELELDNEIHFLTKEFKCSVSQIVLLSAIFYLNIRNEIAYMEKISEYFDCNPIFLIKKYKDFEKLIDAGYLKKFKNRKRRSYHRSSEMGAYYEINEDVANLIITGEKSHQNKIEITNAVEFLTEVYEMAGERDENDKEYDEFERDVIKLIENHAELAPVKAARQFSLDIKDEIIAYMICYSTVDSDEISLNMLMNKVFDNDRNRNRYKKKMLQKDYKLMHHELIKFESAALRTDRETSMTDKGLDIFLGEDRAIFFSDDKFVNDKDVINPATIAVKEMYYNDDNNLQINDLTNMLLKENYEKIKERLKAENMINAFTVLFHGYPGTGKTETVMQLARQTKRPLFVVDVTKFKTCWFGESERNLKRIFEKYRQRVKYSELEPIMLFNEADAIFSKRKDVSSSNVAQTENAIQNIILQEMETLEGILIATTNMIDNFDKAFERRFLYKIGFDKPGDEIALQIWKTRFPLVNEEELRQIAAKYKFSGGQIENIARKTTMNQVLKGITPDYSQIENYCKEEVFTTDNQRKTLGFCIS